MTSRSITIDPEVVHASAGRSAQPEWLDEIAEYVRHAAAEGETVTLTSRRRVLTPAQVADLVGMSRSTISRKIAAGELRSMKVGNRHRIPYGEFERFWRETAGDIIDVSRDDIRADLLGD